ncbi:cytochrome P450 [Byssothecium circinans]|uniref:Cytochrome P450 n=1 Tax=Byssothecium circinans TaxID=147558 RepID=A0A6A5TQF3_9PLEO|nr:cytochrome P450 [Byssothecium circinans]
MFNVYLAWVFLSIPLLYAALCAVQRITQSKREPGVLPMAIPFLSPLYGFTRLQALYLLELRKRFRVPIHTLRMPFARIYVVNAPHLIQAIQAKANRNTYVPNLLDFGMLFSGLSNDGKRVMRHAVNTMGNSFTMSVHKHLLSGPTLAVATRIAVDKLAVSVPNTIMRQQQAGLMGTIRHELTLALTGAIYGPENPYDDPAIEASWLAFLPGITDLLTVGCLAKYTAYKALNARDRVAAAFERYFETGGHLRAFAMIPEMYNSNLQLGLSAADAARMELATSLAMLSSGAITTFWLLFHILSDPEALLQCRRELLDLIIGQTITANGLVNVVDTSSIRTGCPTVMAMFHETLRFHSTVINIKEVAHDTYLNSEYFLKKGSTVMVAGPSVHRDTETWGPSADVFNHRRFFCPDGHKNLGVSTAYRPFGAGATMCPGRNFSINVTLTFVAMVLLKYNVEPVSGAWEMPTKADADMWNAMPKPDTDVDVRFTPRREAAGTQWEFVWGMDHLSR